MGGRDFGSRYVVMLVFKGIDLSRVGGDFTEFIYFSRDVAGRRRVLGSGGWFWVLVLFYGFFL